MFECALCLASAPFAPTVLVLPRPLVSPLLARTRSSHLSSARAIVNPFASPSPCPRHLHTGAPREDAYYRRTNRCVAPAAPAMLFVQVRTCVARQMHAPFCTRACASLQYHPACVSLLAPKFFVSHFVCPADIIECY